MLSRKSILLNALAIILTAALIAGCGEPGPGAGTADPKKDPGAGLAKYGYYKDGGEVKRPRELWPDVEPLAGTGAPAAPPADGGEPPAAPEAATPATGGEAAAGGLSGDVQTVAADLDGRTDVGQSVAFDMKIAGGAAARGPVPAMPTDARVQVMMPDKTRIEGATTFEGRAVRMTVIVNGPRMWMEVADAGGEVLQVIKMDLSALPADAEGGGPLPAASPKPAAMLAELGKDFQFTGTSRGEVAGASVVTFEGTAKSGTGADAPAIRVSFGAEDGLLRQIEKRDEGGRAIETLTASNYDLNPTFTAAVFNYSPPEGVEVLDFMKMMQEMMKALGEGMGGASAP